MAKKGFKVLDSDLHIIEPPDLWLRYIDPEFRDRAPRGLTERAGDVFLVHPDGKAWGMTDEVQQSQKVRSGQNFKNDEQRFRSFEDRGWTAEAQLEAMDAEGIDVAVIYPSRGLFALTIPNMDPRLAAAVAHAYNNWLYDFCQADPNRLIGAGMISAFDVEDAVTETHRCTKELGFRGIFLRPNEVNGRNWHDLYYEPLWSTLEELEVPIGFHEGSGAALPGAGQQFTNVMLRHVFAHPVEQMMVAASFCAGGILERHPNLRAAFLEGNSSWLPFLMWRLDEHWEWKGDVDAPDLTMAPSEYFKRQCFASVEPDEIPAKYTIDYMGSDSLVFSTDFPHPDSRFPDSVDLFLQLPFTDEDKRKILWDNCAHYYGIKE